MIDDDDAPEDNEFEELQPQGDVPEAPRADSRRALSKQQKRIRTEKLETEAFWKMVFADRIGRREMWGILQATGAFEERFACGPNGFPQPEASYFKAGEQSVGMRLYQKWLVFDRDGVCKMHDEFDDRFKKDF